MLRKGISFAAVVLTAAAAVSTAYAVGGTLPLGPAATGQEHVYRGYYDGHKDVYVVTDTSSKSQATAMGINYSPALGTVKGAPFQYFISGPAAPGQLAVFGSEPGETDYNPLWEELFVTWKPGVKPVLLVQDDQINALAKQHKLTVTDAHIVLNAPILKVEK
ncbi:MAG TPA: hypothetical protein VEH55_05275 [Gaiellaceae bacterium]|jgi:hypothetical protein|nr:hypothetical protein [Gaiellaceae bacterium]